MEERVIQQESVTPEEQSVTASETPKAPATPEVPTVPLAEFEALKGQLAEKEKAFQNAKSKIGEYYDDRKKALEDQGMYKPLWEDANKTAQEKDQEIGTLKTQIDELKRSTENAATRNTALSALSNAGAINAGQTLALFSIAIAAAEVAVGLSLIIVAYRMYQNVDIADFRSLKG